MAYIKFPGGESIGPEHALVASNPVATLIVGPMIFSCTSCSEACRCDFDNVIFRSVDFHCANCGTFFRVSNPAFTIKAKT